MLEQARRARCEGEPEQAAEELRRALALWRGPALADFAYESFAQAEIARLDELQLTALEERIEADLALGRDGELVGELEALVARHPLRERLRGQLMLALYRSDRQAEALHVYQEGRLALAQEVGLEPSQGLQRLERRILEQDPALAPPARRVSDHGSGGPSPAGAPSSPASSRWPRRRRGRLPADPRRRPNRSDGGQRGDRGRLRSRARSEDRRAAGDRPARDGPPEHRRGSGRRLGARRRGPDRLPDRSERAFACGPSAPARRRPTSPSGRARSGSETAFAISRPLSRGASPVSMRSRSMSTETIALSGRSRTAAVPALAGQPQTAHRSDARRGLGRQSRPDRLPDQRAHERRRGQGRRRPGLEHRRRRRWRLGRRRGEDSVEIDARTNRVSNRIEVAAASLTALAVGAGAVWAADPVGGSVWRIDPEPEADPAHASRSGSAWPGSPSARAPCGRRTRSPARSIASTRARTARASSAGSRQRAESPWARAPCG